MKKSVFVMGIMAVIFSLGAYYDKSLYPPLPIQSISKKEVLAIANQQSDHFIKITEEDGYEWYMSKWGKKEVFNEVKKMLGKYGWEIQKEKGNKLIFNKGEEQLTITTDRWSKNYTLAKIPVGWDD